MSESLDELIKQICPRADVTEIKREMRKGGKLEELIESSCEQVKKQKKRRQR